MRLADFIVSNIEPILMEWEAFARGITPGAMMDKPTLRDSADTFQKVVTELGHVLPSRTLAITILVKDLARSVLQGTISSRHAASRGARLAIAANYPKSLMPFYMAQEEYDCKDYNTSTGTCGHLTSASRPAIHDIPDLEGRLIAYCREVIDDDPRAV